MLMRTLTTKKILIYSFSIWMKTSFSSQQFRPPPHLYTEEVSKGPQGPIAESTAACRWILISRCGLHWVLFCAVLTQTQNPKRSRHTQSLGQSRKMGYGRFTTAIFHANLWRFFGNYIQNKLLLTALLLINARILCWISSTFQSYCIVFDKSLLNQCRRTIWQIKLVIWKSYLMRRKQPDAHSHLGVLPGQHPHPIWNDQRVVTRSFH